MGLKNMKVKTMKKIIMTIIVCAAVALNFAPRKIYASEWFHTESLVAQARGMETRLRHQGRLFENPQVDAYLNSVLVKLATREEISRYNLRVLVLRDRTVTAFAAPDGALYITTGLLSRLVSEEQVAALIAHEVGHVVMDHTGRRLAAHKEAALPHGRQAQSARIREGVFAHRNCDQVMDCRAQYAEFFRGIIGVAHDVFKPEEFEYSLEFEMEADSVGVARLAAAGYNMSRDTANNISQFFLSATLWNVVLYEAGYAISQGDFELADALLTRLADIGGCYIDVFNMRGDMERMLAPRSTAAFKWYESALECVPENNTTSLVSLGFANFAIGRHERACEFLSRYQEQESQSVVRHMVDHLLDRCANQ